MSESTVQMLLEILQVWCFDQCPGDPLPVTNNPLGEEIFANKQYESLLMQLFSEILVLSSQRGYQHLPLLVRKL